MSKMTFLKGPSKVSVILLSVLFSVLFAIPSLSAQSLGGLSISSYSIKSISPESLRSVKGTVSAVIVNSGEGFTVKGISAVGYRNGLPFVEGTCADVRFVKGKGTYLLSGVVSLSPGISLWNAIGAALSFNPSEYTVDVTASIVSSDGKTSAVVKKGVPVSKFIHR